MIEILIQFRLNTWNNEQVESNPRRRCWRTHYRWLILYAWISHQDIQ